MKSVSIAFAAAVLVSPLIAGSVVKPAAAQGAQASYKQALAACRAQYAGPRGPMGRDRDAAIEMCFHDKTGQFPSQVFPNLAQNRGQAAGCKDVGAPLLVCGEKPRRGEGPQGARELYIDDHTCPPGKILRTTTSSRSGTPIEFCVPDPRPNQASRGH